MRKQRVVACPACAAPVEFKLGTALVTVCDFCRSIVARGDKKVEDHGKVADVLDTHSPIQRGLSGKYQKKRFEVVGRVQYQHPAGGVWNEWYLRFPQDKVGWLAEAQGKFYLLFEKRFSEEAELPSFDSLEIGHRFEIPGVSAFSVAEKGVASARSADGDIPWAFRQYADHRFADLHGDKDEFATLEFDEARPRGFFGREVTLSELNLDRADDALPVTAGSGASQVNCPHCAGPLTLHAPDQSLRVTCPSCKSLLDCEHGKLQFLKTLKQTGVKPFVPLGSVGKLFGTEYTVIGFMERFVVWQGKKFSWTEYLLYQPSQGFRWLVHNQGHWSFVEPVPVSKTVRPRDQLATFDGEGFKLYDKSTAYVRFVVGEFYWRVNVDEQVHTEDYIAPPRMLSFEMTRGDKGQEINVSLGTYLTVDEVEAAFNVQDIPRPFGVGTIQPQPSRADVWGMWVCFASLLAVLDFIFVSGAVKQPVSQFHFFAAQAAVAAFPILMLFGRHTFEINRWSNSDYSPYDTGGDEE
jgi:hypothetical protein